MNIIMETRIRSRVKLRYTRYVVSYGFKCLRITDYASNGKVVLERIRSPGLWRVDTRTRQSSTSTSPICTGSLSILSW
jgi:hypothetical protein